MGLFTKLFGGSRSTQTSQSESYNKAFEPVSTAFSPLLDYATIAGKNISSFFDGDMTGFNKYKDNTGFDFLLGRGMGDVTGNMAARRMFNSGATAKGIQEYGANLNNTFADKYLSGQASLAGIGNEAAKNLIGSGTYSTSTGSGKSSNDTGMLGQMMAAIFASDPRLKTSVERIGELPNGLGLYSFEYLPQTGEISKYTGEGVFIGVMADEVERIQPEALGPVVDGYQTVNYALIEGV